MNLKKLVTCTETGTSVTVFLPGLQLTGVVAEGEHHETVLTLETPLGPVYVEVSSIAAIRYNEDERK